MSNVKKKKRENREKERRNIKFRGVWESNGKQNEKRTAGERGVCRLYTYSFFCTTCNVRNRKGWFILLVGVPESRRVWGGWVRWGRVG